MQNKKHISAIIVAAGKGKRMDSDIPKQYMDIAGKTIWIPPCINLKKAMM
jgi:2-C-methyl-D-erythritol 4-phosphate cytidylyltransferase